VLNYGQGLLIQESVLSAKTLEGPVFRFLLVIVLRQQNERISKRVVQQLRWWNMCSVRLRLLVLTAVKLVLLRLSYPVSMGRRMRMLLPLIKQALRLSMER
jgi:hypothetical protein